MSVVGDGIRALWTRRALERAGFEVTPDSNSRVLVEDTAWLYDDDVFSTLGSLTAAVQTKESQASL